MTKHDIKKIVSGNLGNLKQYKVLAISLFGSYANDEQTENSDIDFLVLFDRGATLYTIVDLQDYLTELLGRSVHVVSRNGLNKRLEPYILQEAEVIEEGI